MPRGQKRARLSCSTADGKRLPAAYPNGVWAIGFHSDATADGRGLRFLKVVEELARAATAIEL